MQLIPGPTETLTPDEFQNWSYVTELFLENSSPKLEEAIITEATKRFVNVRRARALQAQGSDNQALEISFKLVASHTAGSVLQVLYEDAFATSENKALYLQELSSAVPKLAGTETVKIVVQEDNTPAGGDESSSNTGVIVGACVGVGVCVLLLGIVIHRRRRSKTEDDGKAMQEVPRQRPLPSAPGRSNPSHDPTTNYSSSTEQQRHELSQPQQQMWTNVLTLNMEHPDDVSTLEGGTLPDNMTVGRMYEDPTAAVGSHYDLYGINYNKPAAALSGKPTATIASYEHQKFAHNVLYNLDMIAGDADDDQTVKPYQIQAPPGSRLGLVVESSSKVPYIRTVKPGSIFSGQVEAGDLLLQVNDRDVTNMTALDVSELIASQQHLQITLLLVRPNKPNDQWSMDENL